MVASRLCLPERSEGITSTDAVRASPHPTPRYARHVDYIHWNPVKHGYVPRVADWPHSSFHQHVVMGVYPSDWGGGKPIVIAGAE